VGIFVPSWFGSPVRTSYRYLQHFMLHPYLWRYLKGGKLRSWGAKSLQESGKRGEPFLAGEGYARIGECSGSTNVLTGSGVDEAWMSGALLAEGALELLKAGQPFTKANLERTYVARRRGSWLDARRADGPGRLARDPAGRQAAGQPSGRAAAGRQGGGGARLSRSRAVPAARAVRNLQVAGLHRNLLGPGDHDGPGGGVPLFDREKCLHCGACLWNCSQPLPGQKEKANLKFTSGSGGLHSAEN
jgi:hypothetical protein